MIKLKQFLAWLLVINSVIGYAQSFSSPTTIPANGNVTVNGVTITTASTGDANNSIGANPKTPCLPKATSPELTTVPGQLRVGSSDGTPSASTAWSVTLNFSSPVNNVVFSITAVDLAENFIFNSNGGPVSLSHNSCDMNVTGNQAVTNGVTGGSVSHVTGGFFQANSPFPYTQLTINGNGGGFGSVILLSGGSVGCSGTIDSDGDGIADECDLDDDNDGILDTVENGVCGIPNPNTAPGNGVLTRTIFNENFGTMSTANGTTSTSLAGLGSGATTTYNYYKAIAGTTPTNWNDGNGPPYSLDDGRYSVFNNIQQTASWAGSDWQTIGDHTNGGTTPTGGRMLIVNASYNPGEFYRRTLSNVVQGAPINASLWAMNMVVYNGLIDPNITVNFEQPAGNVVYSFNTGDISYNSQGDVNAWKFFKNPTTFLPPTSQPIDVVFVNNAPGGGGNDLAIDDIIVYQSLCDTDNDGIPNYLDVDSDGDGCADAIEGSENVKYNQIHDLNLPLADPNYAYRGQIKVTYNGTTTSTPSGIISNSPSANGVPQLLNNAGNNLNASTNPSNLAGAVDNTDGTADIGQGIGDSQDNTINSCKCYKAPSTDGNNYPTNHGITAFNRAGADNQNWPMERQSGWTALEASTKGFVINRMPASTTGGNAGEPVNGTGTPVITSPIAGMMFYDTTNDCLKINVDGTRSGWKCFNNQSCPDEN